MLTVLGGLSSVAEIAPSGPPSAARWPWPCRSRSAGARRRRARRDSRDVTDQVLRGETRAAIGHVNRVDAERGIKLGAGEMRAQPMPAEPNCIFDWLAFA